VIATLNAGKTLPRALDSVFKQTNENVEILVADGGSVDNTIDILNNCKNNKLVWWKSERDNGLYDAWNKALHHITGDWVLFLGADDELWNGNVVEDFLNKLSDISDVFDIVYGKVAQVNSEGVVWNIAGEPWKFTEKNLKIRCSMMAHQGVFHSRRLFDRGEIFDTKYRISGDYDFLLRVLKNKNALFMPDILVAKMYCGGLSGGFNDFKFYNEFMLARNSNGYRNNIWSLYLSFKYRIRAFIVKYFGLNSAKIMNDFLREIIGINKFPE